MSSLSLTYMPAYGKACESTPRLSLDSNYKPITEHRIDVGKGLKVKGIILSSPDCQPIQNARIEHWQMNSQGNYTEQLRAYLMSDKDGEFSFESEWPGSSTPHIHFLIHAEGYKQLVQVWLASEVTDSINLRFILEPVNAMTLTSLTISR